MGVVVKLWRKAKRKDGKFYVAVVVNYKEYRRVVNTQVYLLPGEWDEKRCKVRGVDDLAQHQQRVINEIANVEELRVMKAKMNRLQVEQFKRVYDAKAGYSLHQAFVDYQKTKTDVSDATKLNYEKTLVFLKKRVPDVELRHFGRKSMEMLVESLLRAKIKPISINLRCGTIVAAVRHAKKQNQQVDETLFNWEKLKVVKEKRQNIDDAVLLNLWRQHKNDVAVRLFFTSLFCCGVDLRDLHNIIHAESDIVPVARLKTNQVVFIEVLPVVKELVDGLDKICPKKIFLNHGQYLKFYSMTKNRLIKLAKVSITVKLARHTWATKAIALGVAKSTVAKALAHAQNSITDVYISKNDFQDVFDANKVVVNHYLELFGELNS